MRSKKAIYNIFSTLLFQIALITYGFVVPKLVISNYGSDVNGLISSITKFLSYIVLIESGFAPVVKYALYKPIAKNDKNTILQILKASERFFRKVSYIFIGYIIILLFVYPLIVNNQFDYLFTASLILIIAACTFCEYYFGLTYSVYLQATQNGYIVSIIQFLLYTVSIIVLIFLAKINCSVHVFKIVSCMFFIFKPIILNIYVKKKFKINYKDVDKSFELKQKWDGLIQHIAYVIHTNTDIALLTIFSTLKEVSVYAVYSLVVTGLKNALNAFAGSVDSTFGDMYARGEHDNLNKKFAMYEICYFSIITIVFVSTMLLITPFVSVYTSGIDDANYIRYTFGYLIVISEFIWAIRNPYKNIVLAVGHFRETNRGAIIECVSNILVSIILVINFGIVGVVIGTIVAMTFRTIDLIYHTNKYILKRKMMPNVKKILLIAIETLLICFVCKYIPFVSYTNYFNWAINGCITFIVSSIIVFTINYLFYKNDFKIFFDIIKNFLKRKKA